MKNIALIGFGKIGKKFFNLSLKKKNISINKILKRKISNFKILNVKFFRNFKTNRSITYAIAMASITGIFIIIFIFHGKFGAVK